MKIINGIGILNPKIAIVGEAPGAEEEIQGKPFVGRSGQLINKIMSELGINRDECYITNVVKFRPENNRTPTNDEIMFWQPFLFMELQIVNPKIVICLGSIAYKAMSNNFKVKITQDRGNYHTVTLFDAGDNIAKQIDYIPTFHPSYCFRNPNQTEKLIEDFKRALEWVNE